jgi:hypothetical protein
MGNAGQVNRQGRFDKVWSCITREGFASDYRKCCCAGLYRPMAIRHHEAQRDG